MPHQLKFVVDEHALRGIICSGGGLFRQFLHADELFVDDGQRAVGGLNHGDSVIGVADALIHRISSRMASPAASSAALSTRRPEERCLRESPMLR